MVEHQIGANFTVGTSLTVDAIHVRNRTEFPAAMAQRAKPVLIEEPQLAQRLSRIAFWDGIQGTVRFIATLIAALLALALALQYGVDIRWHQDWKVEKTDTQIILTAR